MIDGYTPLGHVGFVSWAVQIARTFQQPPKSTLVKKTRKQAIKCMLTLGKNIALHNNHKPDMTYEFFQLSIIPLFVECHYYLDIFYQSNQISFQEFKQLNGELNCVEVSLPHKRKEIES